MSVHRLTLGDVLGEHRRGRPLGTAVVDGDVRLTYPELDARVNRLAAALAADGVGPGERVLWLGQNSFRVLELLLAAARLGAVCCPANWRQSADELAHVLTDLTPKVVVWEESEAVEKARGQVSLDARWVRSGEEYEAYLPAEADEPAAEVGDDAPVLALYTAAFDGRPNAALLSHSALIAHSMALLHIRQMEDGFAFLACGPLFHVGTMMFTLATFQLGGKIVFTPAYEPAEVCRLIDAEKCTQAFLFGPMIDGLVEANKDGSYDLSSLRFVSHSPEWDAMITVDDSPWCASKMGGYGQTEVGGMLTFLGLGMGGAGYAGRPSPLVHVRILDADGAEVAPGEVGEICARGHSVFSGYWNRPELNAAKSAGGWHHTGDLGRREADGTLTFIGPKLRMIKSANENIYPAEVERALKTHPAVADAAVIGVPDERFGQSPKAVVVLKDGTTATAEEIIEHVRAEIASYKKPREVEFTDAIPKRGYTPDYDALDERFGGGAYPGS
ncbi:AMP-binding protein [Actinomadura macrotermitis]|uniref:Long-chain-fatty-acid--CoA ligase FadD13 n=1 Tax=Actinomadura macrotermitis TaxID=2585200 RepID=A0A7K0BP23_9ACTN|nr:AMP-binding protein [Actinomadura macrotermitis]MQY02903.1 Long-chain-fatty-acid--CoA ligase FadD13 [Actinomadura macrotermitis]